MVPQDSEVGLVMRLQRLTDRWIFECAFAERHIPKEAGFRWDTVKRVWFTTDPVTAARLMSPADAVAAREEEEAKYRLKSQGVKDSIAAETEFYVPVPDVEAMRNYQRAGVEYSFKRPHTLNADDPGLGKTIQFCGVVNVLEAQIKKALILCPYGLRINWLREMQRWLTKRWHIAVWNSEVCRPAYVDISILHYDAVHKFSAVLRAVPWDIICLDEVHLLKNPSARRTRAVFGLDKAAAKKEDNKRLAKLATYLPGLPVPAELNVPIVAVAPLRGRRSLAMTGTPLPNRPKECFPILQYLDPVTFKSATKFKNEFCGAEWNGYGMDDKGASNLGQLQQLLRSTVMIRRLKGDVLKELPPKQRCVIEIPHDEANAVLEELEAFKARESDLLAARQAVATAKEKASDLPADYAAAVQRLRAATSTVFSEMSRLRLAAARAKLPYIIDHLRGLLDTDEKIIVFAHHQEIIEAIKAEFGRRCVTCYGPDSARNRQSSVDRFQTDREVRLIVGNYDVMGVGWTLTASWHVVAAELDWVPGRMTQAEDRAHRMGQLNSVLVEHLVLEGSLDAYMARVVVEKQEVQAAALDMEVPVGLPDNLATVASVAAPEPNRPHMAPPPDVRPTAPRIVRPSADYEQASLFGGD